MRKYLIRAVTAAFLAASLLAGCTSVTELKESPQTEEAAESAKEAEAEKETESEDGLGDTFSGTTKPPTDESQIQKNEEPEEEKNEDKDVDLIFFMGQSNMSGAGGDASLAPHVSEDAGMEFRAVSDPTRLYPITEPFGINENDPQGLHEYPGAKKGSLVSSFVNRYHDLTGRKVIAVSISMGATDMNTWMSPGAVADVQNRFDKSVSFLKDNGYNIGHLYAVCCEVE